VKFRALRDGRKLKDTVADLLRKCLAAASQQPDVRATAVARDTKTGLPLIDCKHGASPGEGLTPEPGGDRAAKCSHCPGDPGSLDFKIDDLIPAPDLDPQRSALLVCLGWR
jgi:hypothetical protein